MDSNAEQILWYNVIMHMQQYSDSLSRESP